MADQERRSFTRRLRNVQIGGVQRVGFTGRAAAGESIAPEGANVVGRELHGNERLTAYRHHTYIARGANHVEMRVGPMLYTRNIEDAFDYYAEGLKFAAPRCTIPPYPTLANSHIEEIWVAGMIAACGQCEGDPGDNRLPTYVGGNVLAVGLPDNMLYTAAESNQLIVAGMAITLRSLISEAVRALIVEEFNNPAWMTADHYAEVPQEAFPRLISIMAQSMPAATRLTMMSTYVTFFLSYTNQGNITQQKLTKIQTELAEQQIVVTIPQDRIRDIWVKFGPFFDDEAAGAFFPLWERVFQNRCLRLQLIMAQAANAGLTGLTLIRTMIRLCPDFFWPTLAAICPEDWNSFCTADETVGNQIWYGFKKNLGPVAVNNYKAIAYCAKQLQLRALGDQNMRALNTLNNVVIPKATAIDQLVSDYVSYQGRIARSAGGNLVAVRRYFTSNDMEVPENLGAAADDEGAAMQQGMGPVQDILRMIAAQQQPPVHP